MDGASVQRELRLAVAMNGGISLAVWIGGVAMELDRFVSAQEQMAGEGWGGLKASAHVTARVDVLAGTSAGGLNAVFLALAQAYGGVDLGLLRQLWLDLADLDGELLRKPGGDRSSLLDGDYFHARLASTIDALVADKPVSGREVELLTTATVLDGEVDDISDDFGDVFVNNRYESGFHFRWVPGSDGASAPELAGGARRRRRLAQLAVASRASASFPFAFAPWFCDPDDPQLFARDERERALQTRPAFLVDGGVLNNLPVERLVEAVFGLGASGPVKRVLLAVLPLHTRPAAGGRRSRPADDRHPPTVGQVALAAGISIPRDETDADALRSVARNNQAVAARQAARQILWGRAFTEIRDAAERVWPNYQARGVEQATDDNLTACAVRLDAEVPSRRALLPKRDHLRDAVALASTTPGAGFRGWPWIPKDFPGDGGNWGAATVRRCAAMVLDLCARAVEPLAAHLAAQPDALEEVKRQVHNAMQSANEANPLGRRLAFGTAFAEHLIAGWTGPEQDEEAGPPDLAVLARAAAAAIDTWPGTGQAGRVTLGDAMTALGSALAGLVALWSAEGDASGAPPPALCTAVAGLADEAARANCRTLLVCTEVLQLAFAGVAETCEQKVELGIVSPGQPAPLDPLERVDPDDKLSGDELAHFGAFLKRSWRANDWLWGRLDAATTLSSALGVGPEAKDAVTERQREIVREEAFWVCDSVVRDVARGARCEEGRRLFPGGKVPPESWVGPDQDGSGPTPLPWPELIVRLGLHDEPDPEGAFLERLTIGRERVVGEIRTSLGVRVGTQALATTTGMLTEAGLPRPFQRVVNLAVAPVRGVVAIAYRYARQSTKFPVQVGFAVGTAAVTGLAFADMIGLFPVGRLAPLLWLLVIGGGIAGFLRAPVTSTILASAVGAVGLLHAVDTRPDWMSESLWDRRPDWIGNSWYAVLIVAAGAALVATRLVTVIDDILFESRQRGRATTARLGLLLEAAAPPTISSSAQPSDPPGPATDVEQPVPTAPETEPTPVPATTTGPAEPLDPAATTGTPEAPVPTAVTEPQASGPPGPPGPPEPPEEHEPGSQTSLWRRVPWGAGCALLATMIAIAVVKWVQFERFEGHEWARQLLIVGALGLAVFVVAKRRQVPPFQVLLGSLVTLDTGPDGRRLVAERVVAAGLAIEALALAPLGYLARREGWTWLWMDEPYVQAGLTVAALLPLAVLCLFEWQRRSTVPAPARTALWTVAGGVVLWVGLVAPPLARQGPFHDIELGETLLVTALGEEVIFRGLLLVLALAAGWAGFSFVAVSVGFGLWHIPDVLAGKCDPSWGAGLVTFTAMFLVAQLIFTPLRLRSSTIAAAVLLHAAWNIGLATFHSSGGCPV